MCWKRLALVKDPRRRKLESYFRAELRCGIVGSPLITTWRGALSTLEPVRRCARETQQFVFLGWMRGEGACTTRHGPSDLASRKYRSCSKSFHYALHTSKRGGVGRLQRQKHLRQVGLNKPNVRNRPTFLNHSEAEVAEDGLLVHLLLHNEAHGREHGEPAVLKG